MKLICLTLGCILTAVSPAGDDVFSRGFAEPPAEARPRCWWHWMSNFISKEGITKDLEAMKRAGLGGATILDICEMKTHGRVKSLSDEWYALVQHAGREADRLGLMLSFHNCPGWSSSGGPWIKPEQAMKMLGWNETVVDGGRPVSVRLPAPVAPLGWYCDVEVRGGLTRIPLELPHAGSVFVVFRKNGASSLRGTSASAFQPAASTDNCQMSMDRQQGCLDLSRDWKVRFQPERGAPEGEIAFPELRLFNTFEDFGIRHFSGVATYSNSTARPWAKTSPLVPAGLEGPVELKTTSRMKAEGSL